MTQAVDVSVVVPAREAAETIEATLHAILAQKGVGRLEVAVAVSPEDQVTRAAVEGVSRTDGRVFVVDNPAGTTPAGLNVAIAATSAPVVVRCDAHALLPPDFIATAVEVLDERAAGNVGGRQIPEADAGFSAAIAAAMRSPLGSGGATYRSGASPRPAETVYLGVFRRQALEDVGGFDERLLRNQDYELNHRLRNAGWPVWFDPRLSVRYRPRASLGELARQYRDYGRYKRVVMRQHPSSIRARQLAPLAMVAGVAGSVALGIATARPWAPGMAAGGYLLITFVGGVCADRRRPVQVAAALTTMHWAWAIGFLQGPRSPRLCK